jgi:hypothetical protein
MKTAPKGYWKEKQNRVNALKEMIAYLGKPITELTQRDLTKLGFGGIMGRTKSFYNALREAGYEIDPLKMVKVPQDYWNKKENRVNAVKKLVEGLNKPITELTKKDFYNANGVGLLSKYKSSPYKALKDAGYEILPWQMKRTPFRFWNDKNNRIEAVKWLVKKLGKPIDEITDHDFIDNGLGGLLDIYHPIHCSNFERGEIISYEPGYLLQFKNRVTRALVEAELITPKKSVSQEKNLNI